MEASGHAQTTCQSSAQKDQVTRARVTQLLWSTQRVNSLMKKSEYEYHYNWVYGIIKQPTIGLNLYNYNNRGVIYETQISLQ